MKNEKFLITENKWKACYKELILGFYIFKINKLICNVR